MRCLYCHNPDSRPYAGGRPVTVDEVMAEVVKYRSYMRFSGGGITVSGGEPLAQPEFVAALFRRCRAIGVHVALDTSGCVPLVTAMPVYDLSDLVLLDIKSINPEKHVTLTGRDLGSTLAGAGYLSERGIPVWIRHVVVPGLTDDPDDLGELADFCAGLRNVERVELLPFHNVGAFKWRQLGLNYELDGMLPPSPEFMSLAGEIFASRGLPVG